jgi:hypothetical protein
MTEVMVPVIEEAGVEAVEVEAGTEIRGEEGGTGTAARKMVRCHLKATGFVPR